MITIDSCRVDRTNISLGVDHAENEEAPNGGEHDDGLEPEECFQLVRSEGAEWEMDKPEQEEGEHATCCDPNGLRDMIRDIGEFVTEDATKNVQHEACTRVDFQLSMETSSSRLEERLTLDTIPNDGQSSPGPHEVVAAPHTKYTSGNNWISNMVHASTPGVEEHCDGRDQLTGKDHKDTLPPVQPNSDHCTPQCPVAERKAHVEGDIIPPSPWEAVSYVLISEHDMTCRSASLEELGPDLRYSRSALYRCVDQAPYRLFRRTT